MVGVKAVLQANLLRVRHAWKRRTGTIGEGPLAIGDRHFGIVLVHPLGEGKPRVTGGDARVSGSVGARIREDILGPRGASRSAYDPSDRTTPVIVFPLR